MSADLNSFAYYRELSIGKYWDLSIKHKKLTHSSRSMRNARTHAAALWTDAGALECTNCDVIRLGGGRLSTEKNNIC